MFFLNKKKKEGQNLKEEEVMEEEVPTILTLSPTERVGESEFIFGGFFSENQGVFYEDGDGKSFYYFISVDTQIKLTDGYGDEMTYRVLEANCGNNQLVLEEVWDEEEDEEE